MERWSRGPWKTLVLVIAPAWILLLVLGASGQTQASSQARAGEAGLRIPSQDPRAVSVDFVGLRDAIQALKSGEAQALSLARGDFDENGIEDLVTGYSAPGGKGIV